MASGCSATRCWRSPSVIAFSFVVTWLIAMGIEHTIGLRVASDDEEHLDEVQQGMRAYDDSPFASSSSATGPC